MHTSKYLIGLITIRFQQAYLDMCWKVIPYIPVPEWPEVSMAVPKKSTYSVTDACRRHMAPIHPPAFTKIHSL